jgi:hypothetical protein
MRWDPSDASLVRRSKPARWCIGQDQICLSTIWPPLTECRSGLLFTGTEYCSTLRSTLEEELLGACKLKRSFVLGKMRFSGRVCGGVEQASQSQFAIRNRNRNSQFAIAIASAGPSLHWHSINRYGLVTGETRKLAAGMGPAWRASAATRKENCKLRGKPWQIVSVELGQTKGCRYQGIRVWTDAVMRTCKQ